MSDVPLLRIERISKHYGGVVAVDGVTLEVDDAELVAVIGPNGAGKTTLFKLIGGLERPSAGDIAFRGLSLKGKSPSRRVRLGVVQTSQGIRLFENMTILENVLIGSLPDYKARLLGSLWKSPRFRQTENAALSAAQEALWRVSPALFDRLHDLASALPYGDQRRVEIARAIASKPALLLLDEPAAGLSAIERGELSDLLRQVHRDGVTIILIEHDVPMVMKLVDRIIVFDQGRLLSDGAPDDVRNDDAVISAYLGRSGEKKKPQIRDDDDANSDTHS